MKFKTNFKQSNKPFNASMLKIGEMMEVMEGIESGDIFLRTYSEIVNLCRPNYTHLIECTLIGRKLLPGESITLIQE